MQEAKQVAKPVEVAEVVEAPKPKEPAKKAYKPVETAQFKEFLTLNGAVRRDLK